MSTKFFTNQDDNSLLNKFEGVFANIESIKHFDALVGYLEELPELGENMSDEKKLSIIKSVFNRLNDKNHPVRTNLFYMDSIPEIRIIEGKNESN